MELLEIFKKYHGNRDPLFQELASLLFEKSKKLDILEIGCARNFNETGRISDGWSSFHFANILDCNTSKDLTKCFGNLTSVDIDSQALATLNQVLTETFPNIYHLPILRDGLEVLNMAKEQGRRYDLIYLDGGDDPNQTLLQFEIAKEIADIVAFDDFHTKGLTIKLKYNLKEDFTILRFDFSPHELAIYPRIKGLPTLTLPNTEALNHG